jgi:hypothetical protein
MEVEGRMIWVVCLVEIKLSPATYREGRERSLRVLKSNEKRRHHLGLKRPIFLPYEAEQFPNHVDKYLVYLDCYIITPIYNGPFIPVPDSSNNTLYCSQINNLINTKFLVVIDIVS